MTAAGRLPPPAPARSYFTATSASHGRSACSLPPTNTPFGMRPFFTLTHLGAGGVPPATGVGYGLIRCSARHRRPVS